MWRGMLHVPSFIYEAIKYGVKLAPERDIPRTDWARGVPWEKERVRWTQEEIAFGQRLIEKRLTSGVWEELETSLLHEQAHCVAREFLVYKGTKIDRAVADFSEMTEYFPRMKMKYESLAEFCGSLTKGDRLLTWDFRSGYNHFRLHPSMRKYFVVRFMGRHFRYIALPFGWGPSGYYFIKITRWITRYLQEHFGWRVLQYVDDNAVCPARPGKTATMEDCRRASSELDCIFRRLGMTRHPEKGHWGDGATRVEHLGFTIDTVAQSLEVPVRKREEVVALARRMLMFVRRNRRRVPLKHFRTFVGKVQSLSLAVPFVRSRLGGLHDSFRRTPCETRRRLVVLRAPAIQDLLWWRTAPLELCGRSFVRDVPTLTLHTGPMHRRLDTVVPGNLAFYRRAQ